MTRRVLLGLIVVTSSVFAFVYASLQAHLFTALAIGFGVIWFALEATGEGRFSTVFFVAFLALAVFRSINQAPVVMLLLGLTTNLAAWDLSRFQARIVDEATSDAVALLEARHLQKQAVTVGAGFVIALLPVLIQISMSFLVLFIIILLIMVALRRSILLMGSETPTRDTAPRR